MVSEGRDWPRSSVTFGKLAQWTIEAIGAPRSYFQDVLRFNAGVSSLRRKEWDWDMTNRAKFPFYFVILLVVAGLSIAGCGGNVCGPLGGSGAITGGPGKGGDGSHPALFRPAATTACGTGGGGSTCSSTLTPSNVAYALDATGNVLEYAIDTSGNLALMCTTTPAATAVGGELAVSKNNFLYVLDKSTTPQIFSFIIGHANTGTLTPHRPQGLTFTDAKIDGFAHIIADPAGNFIYVTNLDGNNI